MRRIFPWKLTEIHDGEALSSGARRNTMQLPQETALNTMVGFCKSHWIRLVLVACLVCASGGGALAQDAASKELTEQERQNLRDRLLTPQQVRAELRTLWSNLFNVAATFQPRLCLWCVSARLLSDGAQSGIAARGNRRSGSTNVDWRALQPWAGRQSGSEQGRILVQACRRCRQQCCPIFLCCDADRGARCCPKPQACAGLYGKGS